MFLSLPHHYSPCSSLLNILTWFSHSGMKHAQNRLHNPASQCFNRDLIFPPLIFTFSHFLLLYRILTFHSTGHLFQWLLSYPRTTFSLAFLIMILFLHSCLPTNPLNANILLFMFKEMSIFYLFQKVQGMILTSKLFTLHFSSSLSLL